MPADILNPQARITHLCSDFFDRLSAVGCGEFYTDNPKKAISLLLAKIEPWALRGRLRRRVAYELELEDNMKKFIQALKVEAVASQDFSGAAQRPPRTYTRTPSKVTSPSATPARNDTLPRTPGSATRNGPPICLYAPHKAHGIKNYMRDCKDCPEGEKKKLLHNHRRSQDRVKRAHDKAQSAHDAAANEEEEAPSGVMFTAVFGGKHRDTVCADTCASTNLMDSELLSKLELSGVSIQVENLPHPRVLLMAAELPDGNKAEILCRRVATIDTELHIRHGTALMLRNLRWNITDQRVGEPLLGGPMLEALGLNTRNILAAAAAKYSGTVDVTALVGDDTHYGESRISRVMDGIFHEDDGEDQEDATGDTQWCDLGPETDEEWERAAALRLKEASANGISKQGCERLESLLRKYREFIRVRLDGGPPARVPSLQLNLKADARPVRAKPRRYPPEKRAFLRNYSNQFVKLGFAKPARKSEWVSAPLIVPKQPPAMYRMTVDYRPINAATRRITWPMPQIEAELSDMRGADAFASIDFCSGYWQLPLHVDSQPLHSFMTTDGVLQPTRTTQGGCN